MNDLELSLAFKPTALELKTVQELPTALLPKISVVIPSFNQAAFIAETLESVLRQEYPLLEVYVADGGSTDGTVEILEAFQSAHPDVMRFDSRPDGGHFHGVNKGIANTTGEVIAWINSDDVYLPNAFWNVATFFYFNRGAFAVYGRNRYVDVKLDPVTDYPVDWSPLLSEQRRRMMHFCLVPQPSLFFKRHAVTLCGALISPILDYELWLRWQKDIPFFFLDGYLSLSRLHDKAITANANAGLLRGICKVVHQYYGAVPYSWAFKYAYTEVHGAAWTRGEAPSITRRVKWLSVWYWISLNVIWSPRSLIARCRQLKSYLLQLRRIAA